MKKAWKYIELFLPVLILIFGGMIMVSAGINDCTRCSGVFEAVKYMKPYGNIGAAITIIGFITFYWRPWRY